MEEPLKSLMQDLGNAIEESLSGSKMVNDGIRAINRAGYDVFVVLEATIGFNKRDDSEIDSDVEAPNFSAAFERLEAERAAATRETSGKISFTTHDHRFLKALRIAVDEEV